MVYKGDKLLPHCSAGSKSSLSCLMKVAISFQDGAMSLCLLKGYISSYSETDKASTTRSPFYKGFNPVDKGDLPSPSTPFSSLSTATFTICECGKAHAII